jgi:hypothetical protein
MRVSALVALRELQNVQTEHPPDYKKRNDTEHNVGYPLACGFWLSEVEHKAILALG